MYPNPKVVAAVERQFVPVRVHVKESGAEFQRLGAKYDAHWTPTILVLDGDGGIN